ncbi:DUF4129 domain-containing protein [Arcanobacterium ihumii]|uniref:DUF4129 domain-containing protein n=1 Tax=Arcanobacterium ihumii TaxID=2138162 RepID=UPI000F521C41|nr:DUF4129 domain-containing protein [Arcanobacterium ihumii]
MILDVPSIPDADTARQLAEEELAKAKYRNAESLVQRFISWLGDLFKRTFSDGTSQLKVADIILLVLIFALLVVLGYLIVRYIRRARVKAKNVSIAEAAKHSLFNDSRTSAQLFADADAALQRRDVNLAVVERFRGVIRHLDEKKYLAIRPGMTATEAARDASSAISHHELLFENAQWFNKVYYADYVATNEAVALSYRVMEIVKAMPMHKTRNEVSELINK